MENVNEKAPVTVESEFSSKSITKLFWKYSIFAIAGLGFQAASVVADGIFVGTGLGEAGLAAISIIVPFWLLSVGFFGLFGVGASTLSAVKLGNNDVEAARAVYGKVIAMAFYISIVICLILFFMLDTVLVRLGATPDILPDAKAYAIPYLVGLPFCVVGTIAYYYTRLAEKPLAASVGYIAPAIIAIVAEYVFIFKMDMGMAGSAIPWVLCVGLSVFLIPYLQAKTVFKIKASDFVPDFKIVFESSKIGFAMFCIQVATIISTAMINNLIGANGGTGLDFASFGLLNAYIGYIFMLFTTAFTMGLQPIASYNMGAKLYDRVAQLIKVGIIQSTLAVLALLIITFIFADPIITFFVGPVPELVANIKTIMQIWLVLYALGNVSQIVSGFYMAIERNGFAILNGIARIFLFAVPLLLILPNFFGLKGVWMAQPGADILAFALAIFCVAGEYKRMKKMGDVSLNEGSVQ